MRNHFSPVSILLLQSVVGALCDYDVGPTFMESKEGGRRTTLNQGTVRFADHSLVDVLPGLRGAAVSGAGK